MIYKIFQFFHCRSMKIVNVVSRVTEVSPHSEARRARQSDAHPRRRLPNRLHNQRHSKPRPTRYARSNHITIHLARPGPNRYRSISVRQRDRSRTTRAANHLERWRRYKCEGTSKRENVQVCKRHFHFPTHMSCAGVQDRIDCLLLPEYSFADLIDNKCHRDHPADEKCCPRAVIYSRYLESQPRTCKHQRHKKNKGKESF